MTDRDRAWTPRLLGLFFLFGAAMTALAGASLAWPDGPLAPMWRLKPDEFRQMLALGGWVPIGFFALSPMMAATAYGAWTRRRWGWALAMIIFAVNGVSDLARAAFGAPLEGLFGAAIAALVLWWLARRDVRAMFR
jgi:hypothetical protein